MTRMRVRVLPSDWPSAGLSIVSRRYKTRPLDSLASWRYDWSLSGSFLRRSASSLLEIARHSTKFGISRACFKATKRFLAAT